MQCKKCNAFIPEGYMYCPVCGEEIIIVSDFEIKLEDNIDAAAVVDTARIPDVNKKINNQILTDKTVEIPDLDSTSDLEKDILELDTKKKSLGKKWIVPIIILSVVLVVGLIFGIIQISRYLSYDYQYNKGVYEADNGEFQKAIKTLKHANSLQENENCIIMIADVFMAMSNYDAAIAIMYDNLNKYNDDIVLYDKIVECYQMQGDSDGIHELIENSGDPNLALRYSAYISISPTFSLDSGTYIEPDPIKLNAPEGGQIYYTTDGSTPTVDSLLYMGPIPLDVGITEISAFYVNENGISSEIVKNIYSVELNVPDAPELLVESGSLSKPSLIGVNYDKENSVVYYTTDGSTPTEDSKEYKSSFLMPLGKSKYCFIAYNSEGVASESVLGVYDLEIVDNVSTSKAEYAIAYHLTSLGENVLLNSYKCQYGYSDGNSTYYIIEEYVGDTKSGRYFAVDTSIGALYTFDKSSYSINPF